MEADYALKYANSSKSINVKELGLTDNDLADMYDYTKVIATDSRAGKGGYLRVFLGRLLLVFMLTELILLKKS